MVRGAQYGAEYDTPDTRLLWYEGENSRGNLGHKTPKPWHSLLRAIKRGLLVNAGKVDKHEFE